MTIVVQLVVSWPTLPRRRRVVTVAASRVDGVVGVVEAGIGLAAAWVIRSPPFRG